MTDKMTKWGAGPKFTVSAVIYCLIMFGLTIYFDPFLKVTETLSIPYQSLELTGIILVVLGVPFHLPSLTSVMCAFNEGQLVAYGVYGMCRHPVYAAWMLFSVPGRALLMDSWALLSAPFIMYLMARSLVAKEDHYLTETFGQEYLSYKQKVPAFLAYGRIKRRAS